MPESTVHKGRNYTRKTNVRKWGNSQGIRLSKEIMSQMELKENDAVEISIYDGKMMIEKISRPGYRDLKERLEAFYQKPIDEIYVDGTQEAEAGNPAGKE